MNSINIIREQGGIPAVMQGEDHISAYLAYMEHLPSAFETKHIQEVSTMETVEKLGITADSSDWEVQVLHYQLSEIFRLNPAIILYLGLFPKLEAYDFAQVKTLQNYANGAIRQVAIYLGDVELNGSLLNSLQSVCDSLDQEGTPLSALIAPKVSDVKTLPTNLRTMNSRVSVIIAEDMEAVDGKLRKASKGKSVSAIGVFLGLLSKAKVHQSISYVGGFPTGVSLAGFSDGTAVREYDKGFLLKLDKAGYLFLHYHPSINGAYVNDSHTMDDPQSDYKAIERVRVMDKAVRGIRKALTKELGGNIYANKETGELSNISIKHLESVGGRALEDMERASELSGYKLMINPKQDALASSALDIVIKEVPTGVIRRFNISIGFTTKLN